MYTKVVNQRNEVAHLPFDQPSNYLKRSDTTTFHLTRYLWVAVYFVSSRFIYASHSLILTMCSLRCLLSLDGETFEVSISTSY